MGKKSKDAKRRDKKQRTGKKHLTLKPHEYYEISGDSVSRKKKNCPRCGPGTWLGEHKGRLYCGKCGYSEFERKPEQPSPQEPEQKPAESAPAQEQAQKPEAPTQKHPEEHKGTGTQKGTGKHEPSADAKPAK